MWSAGKKGSAIGLGNVAASGSIPCTPVEKMRTADRPSYATPSNCATPNSRGDRVDSALKDMAMAMKQVNRAEEAIEAIKSLRHLCSPKAQESIDNVLLELYKKCGRIDDQIELLNFKLKMIDEGLAFGGRRTKLTRSKGKKVHVSLDHEKRRKALAIEQDYHKQCNLAICLMKTGRIEEARSMLQVVKRASSNICDQFLIKSFKQASQMLLEIEPQENLNKKAYELQQGTTFRSGDTTYSHIKREERIVGADHALKKAATTNDCRVLNSKTIHDNSVLNESNGKNSSSSEFLINKNTGQRSIQVNDCAKEEYETWSKRCHECPDSDHNSILSIGNTGEAPDSSIVTSDRTAKPDHVAMNHRFEDCIRKPRSLNDIWATESVKTPKEKGNGNPSSNIDVNWNQGSDALTNNGRQIDSLVDETSTGSSNNYQCQISGSNLASSAVDAKTDKITSFLTGVRGTWADLIEEQEATQDFRVDVTATDTTVVAYENYPRTQLVKKSERKYWEEMVEVEQFATQNSSIDIVADDKIWVFSENYLQTQLIKKSERRTWADIVEEEELSENAIHSSCKAITCTTEGGRDSSEEYLRTPFVSHSGRCTSTGVLREDGPLIDENPRNNSAADPSRKHKDLGSTTRSKSIKDAVFEDENTDLNIAAYVPRRGHHISQNCKEMCQKLSMVDLRSENSSRTAKGYSSVRRTLSFDAEPTSDPSEECMEQFVEIPDV
ncbi:Tetratricopeptide repeat [Musa troglodytarum]|uniref:Tetratricopeptide repeat n=1 Tax=Musa troglodytarum TaxID=320322 RepID=A0A9E7K776_9LILI|nr:Tetratricopeptide repeat [Musa troglodytarum]